MDFRGIPVDWEYSIAELSGLARHLPASMFVEHTGQDYPREGLVIVPQPESVVLVMKNGEPLCTVRRPTIELSVYVAGDEHREIPVEFEPTYRRWIERVMQPALASLGWSSTEPERVDTVGRLSPHGPFNAGWLRFTMRCDEQTVERRASRVRWLAACFQKVEAIPVKRMVEDVRFIAGRDE
jgi:hypothetical protein